MICLEETMHSFLSLCRTNITNYSLKLFKAAELLILREKNNIVGISAFYANDLHNKTAYLSFIAILPDIEGLGWGRALLTQSEKQAKDLGMNKMRLEVFDTNLHAINFYIKMGYTDVGRASNHSKYMVKILGEC